jgi:hypothetical protein
MLKLYYITIILCYNYIKLQLYYITIILYYNYIMLQLYYVTITFSTQFLYFFRNQIQFMYSLSFSVHKPQLEILCAHLF